MISNAIISFCSSFVRLQNTNFTSTFAPSRVCVPYTRRRKCRRRYWSGSVRTPMRILMLLSCCSVEIEVFVVSIEREVRRNWTSFMEINTQRKNITIKQENMKRPLFGFGDFTTIVEYWSFTNWKGNVYTEQGGFLNLSCGGDDSNNFSMLLRVNELLFPFWLASKVWMANLINSFK